MFFQLHLFNKYKYIQIENLFEIVIILNIFKKKTYLKL